MVVETAKDGLCINQIVGQKTEIVVVEGDVIVPDVKPDILNTITVSGNVCVYKKEVSDGRVRLDGCINAYIVYLADCETSNVRGLNTSLDFSQNLDIEHCRSNMSVDEEVCIKAMECKVLNGRKVCIKATLEIKVKVYSNENVEVIKQVGNISDIQTLNSNLQINSLMGCGTTMAYAKDTIMIDNIDNLAEILKADVKIINKDIKVSYNKILAKADANVKIVYLTEDDRINVVNSQIPVMGFIDIPNVSEENICDMKYKLNNLVIKPNTIEEHSIYVEAQIELCCNVFENKNIDMIQDLYSPSENLTFTQKTIKTMLARESCKDICEIREKQAMPELGSNQIYDVSINPMINTANVMNDRIMYEGEVELNFMFASNITMGLDTKMVRVPFSHTMEANGIMSGSTIDTSIEIRTQDFIVMDGYVDIKIDLEFRVNSSRSMDINIIDEVNCEEDRVVNYYSMVIYFVKPGDTLWKIAKRFRSTVEAIARVNDIENPDKINVGQQLFIPRYIVSRSNVSA